LGFGGGRNEKGKAQLVMVVAAGNRKQGLP
jgi:hypothetical protein